MFQIYYYTPCSIYIGVLTWPKIKLFTSPRRLFPVIECISQIITWFVNIGLCVCMSICLCVYVCAHACVCGVCVCVYVCVRARVCVRNPNKWQITQRLATIYSHITIYFCGFRLSPPGLHGPRSRSDLRGFGLVQGSPADKPGKF
jgi:hypothetical protein